LNRDAPTLNADWVVAAAILMHLTDRRDLGVHTGVVDPMAALAQAESLPTARNHRSGSTIAGVIMGGTRLQLRHT